ncbi:hypothetical protein [Thauera sp.]|jgi:shikimate 5-dehydrogenase|uniref:hypothetical protein n=1 Tax=Thauera sp. TaxID=1905334 RepID=UPI002A365DEE|nr:hypothetical protein [Thauera sp.]MDX9886394.1 hypothetical protein [Thauera sp.]
MKDENTKLSRRNFLAAIGAGGAASAAALAATAAQASPVTAEVVEHARREVADQGVSEHMRNYYRTTRI